MNTTKTPVQALIETIGTLDLAARAYTVRPICASLNAMAAGLLHAHFRRTAAEEGSGIDGFNDTLAKAMEAEVDGQQTTDNGFEVIDRWATADALIDIRNELLDLANLPDAVRAACSTPGETIKFLMDRPVDPKTVEAMAKALELDAADIRTAMEKQRGADRMSWLHHRDAITEVLSETDAVDTESFDKLPAKYKMRVCASVRKAVERQVQVAVTAILRGAVDKAGDVTLLKAALAACRVWEEAEANASAAYAMLLAA
jgi:hypothetical protein